MKTDQINDKEHLLEEFLFAAHELRAMHSAQYAARQSESHAEAILSGIQARNGIYITPNDMSVDDRDEFMLMSADAQLKKQQSYQILAAAQEQIALQENNLRKSFKGIKITFITIDQLYQPFESLWFSPTTNKWDKVQLNTTSVKGIVEDISLSENVVVLKPIYWQRKLNPNRKFLLVYIINPTTLALAVSAS